MASSAVEKYYVENYRFLETTTHHLDPCPFVDGIVVDSDRRAHFSAAGSSDSSNRSWSLSVGYRESVWLLSLGMTVGSNLLNWETFSPATRPHFGPLFGQLCICIVGRCC